MDKVVETVTSTLQKEPDVIALLLFGSRATGKHTKHSDYDFFVILDKNTKDSLREDELIKKVAEARLALKSNAIIHLTFQYLFILEEDRSLLLKINDEGKLLFSKGMLFGSTEQFKLKRFFLCKWGIDENRIPERKNRQYAINMCKMQVNRLLKGYRQPYVYEGKKKTSKRKGLIDNIGIFGQGDLLIVIDSMLPQLKKMLERYGARLDIINPIYMPSDNIDGIWKYDFKQELEKYLKKENKEVYLISVNKFEHDKLSVNYMEGEQKTNTIIEVIQLPIYLKKYLNYFDTAIDFAK